MTFFLDRVQRHFAGTHPTIHILCCLLGIASWIDLSGVLLEQPLFITKLPEKQALSSNLNLIIQIANVGPFIFAILVCLFPKRKVEVPTTGVIVMVGVVSCFLLSFFWDVTTYLGGVLHSTALFTLCFTLAFVDSTSTLAFLAFMAMLKPAYLPAYFVGEGLSTFLPTLVTLVQGTGKVNCVNMTFIVPRDLGGFIFNFTIIREIPVFDPPLISVQGFFLIMTLFLCCSFAAFILLICFPKYGKFKCAYVEAIPQDSEANDVRQSEQKAEDGDVKPSAQMTEKSDVNYSKEISDKGDVSLSELKTDVGDAKTSELKRDVTPSNQQTEKHDINNFEPKATILDVKPIELKIDVIPSEQNAEKHDISLSEIKAEENSNSPTEQKTTIRDVTPPDKNGDVTQPDRNDIKSSKQIDDVTSSEQNNDVKPTQQNAVEHNGTASEDKKDKTIAKRNSTSTPHLRNTNKVGDEASENDKNMADISRGQCAFLLLQTFWLMCLLGIYISMTPYFSMPFGLKFYHLSNTLSAMALAGGSLAYFVYAHKSIALVSAMSVLHTALTAFFLYMASTSPVPPLLHDDAGPPLLICLSILIVFLWTYSRVIIIGIIRPLGRNMMILVGVSIQLGSLVGGVTGYVLVSVYKVFTESEPCSAL